MVRKLVILSFLLTLALVVPTSSVYAQTATPKPTTRGEQVRKAVKTGIAQARVEKKLVLEEKKQNLIKSYFEKMMDRFDAAIKRVEKLITRIESRIEKIEVENPTTDLTEVKEELADAKDELTKLITEAEAVKSDFEEVLISDEPKVVFKEVITQTRVLKKDLAEIHVTLVKVIGDIKGLRVGNEKE